MNRRLTSTMKQVLKIYAKRRDLQRVFPEVLLGDYHVLLEWVSRVIQREDGAYRNLKKLRHELEVLLSLKEIREPALNDWLRREVIRRRGFAIDAEVFGQIISVDGELREPGAQDKLKASFDVIIPTKNSGETLEYCMRALGESDVPINSLIVIDKHSSDGSAEIATRSGAKVVQGNWNYSQSLRVGARVATTTHVLILDSDVLIDPYFYTKLRPYIKSNFVTKGIFYNKMNWEKLSDYNFRRIWEARSPGLIPALEAAFVEREKFLELTKFWENGRMDAGGDAVLFEICRRAGIPIIQVSNAVNVHLYGSFTRRFKQGFWYGRSNKKGNFVSKWWTVSEFLLSPYFGVRLAALNRDPRFLPFKVLDALCYLSGWLLG